MPPEHDGVVDVLPVDQPQQALDRARLPRSRRRRPRPRAVPAGRHRDRELQAGRAGQVRPRLRTAPRSSTRRLVYLSISGFGTAEGAWLPGYDLVVQAVSGLMSLTGEPDGPAYRSGIAVFDVMTGLHGTIGVLAALRQRAETGVGQHVEVNLLSSALSGPRQPDRRVHGRPASCRTAWATPTRASTRTSRCRRRTATSSSPPPTTASSGRCARCSASPRSPTTSASGSTPTAPPTAPSSTRSSSSGSPSGRPTICSSPSTRPACRAARSTRSARASSSPSGSGSNRA